MLAKNFTLTYQWGQPYDDNLKELVVTGKHFIDKGDDFRLLIVGDTGTGKSNLALWIMDMFLGDKADIKYFGLNERQFAQAIKYAKEVRRAGERYVLTAFDEANVLGTETMTPFNRALLKLYGEIRGLGLFHVWCTSLPGQLQSGFIDDCIDAIIFIYTKTDDFPRLYYFFDRAAIDKLRREEGGGRFKARLTLDLLRDKAKYYATYKGCFRPYDGALLNDYLERKSSKIDDRVDNFYETYGSEWLSMAEIAREQHVNAQTIHNWFEKAVAGNYLYEEEHYTTNGAGKVKFSREGATRIVEFNQKSKFSARKAGGGSKNRVFAGPGSISNAHIGEQP